MNKIEKAAISGVAGTTLMTLFSYLASVVEKENFSEPEHLTTLIHRLVPGSKEMSRVQGWAAHYGVGLLFAAIYVELWERGMLKPSMLNGAALGTASGGLAVAVWKMTFKMHPAPPWIKYNKYYAQLVPAHVVFALFATLAYKWLKNKEKNDPHGEMDPNTPSQVA